MDRIGAEFHELSGRAKDMGSAAVLMSILLALFTLDLTALVAFSITIPEFDNATGFCFKFGSKITFNCIYSQHNCIYTPGGGMKALTAEGSKRCSILSAIASPKQVCRRRVRKSRNNWGSVPQMRLKNTSKRWRARGYRNRIRRIPRSSLAARRRRRSRAAADRSRRRR